MQHNHYQEITKIDLINQINPATQTTIHNNITISYIKPNLII